MHKPATGLKILITMFLLGGLLAIGLPSAVHWGLLADFEEAPWLAYAWLGSLAICCLSSIGFLINAKASNTTRSGIIILTLFTLLQISFLIYLVKLIIS